MHEEVPLKFHPWNLVLHFSQYIVYFGILANTLGIGSV